MRTLLIPHLGYLFAVLSMAGAWSLKVFFSLWLGSTTLLLPLIVGVMASAVFWGRGPGILAALLGFAATVGEFYQMGGLEPGLGWPLGLYTLASVAFLFMTERTRHRGEELRTIRDTLQERNRELEALGAQLNGAREEAHTANLARDRFFALLSHELRTPLTPALLLAETLEGRESLPESVRQDASMIRRHLALEARLIDDLIDLTRVEKGSIHLARETVSLHVLARRVAGMVQGEADAQNIALTLDLQAEDPYVSVDRARFKQVILSLVGNALKFTPKEGIITIATRRSNDGKSLLFSVRDTGIGIGADALATIFDAFEQGDWARRQFGGLGLGLAIANALVRLHGGTLKVASEGPGRGACFTIHLPLAQKPSSEWEAPREALPGGLRILLVEDHEATGLVLSRLLKRRGHLVELTANLRDAKACDGRTIDLLVSDIGLPDGSGIEVVRHYRTVQRKGFKAIALSGFGMENDVERSIKAGFDRHMTKPVDFETLHGVIADLFRPRLSAS